MENPELNEMIEKIYSGLNYDQKFDLECELNPKKHIDELFSKIHKHNIY